MAEAECLSFSLAPERWALQTSLLLLRRPYSWQRLHLSPNESERPKHSPQFLAVLVSISQQHLQLKESQAEKRFNCSKSIQSVLSSTTGRRPQASSRYSKQSIQAPAGQLASKWQTSTVLRYKHSADHLL